LHETSQVKIGLGIASKNTRLDSTAHDKAARGANEDGRERYLAVVTSECRISGRRSEDAAKVSPKMSQPQKNQDTAETQKRGGK
jgi:hypothetical protein